MKALPLGWLCDHAVSVTVSATRSVSDICLSSLFGVFCSAEKLEGLKEQQAEHDSALKQLRKDKEKATKVMSSESNCDTPVHVMQPLDPGSVRGS